MNREEEKKPRVGLLKRVIRWWNYSPRTLGEQIETERKYLIIAIVSTIINIAVLLMNAKR